ncbi:universal stress protein [Streptomyces sp. NPDC086554]|uniref:universal stress protein n=1 Tax=Streptomyces sp. NPDC086554 TaxID=3154864 RepID=UPI00341D3880
MCSAGRTRSGPAAPAPQLIVGLDGSPESRAAAEWAAREARLCGLPLKVVHVWEPVPEPVAQAPLLGTETQQHWSERVPREIAEMLEPRHPGVTVTAVQLNGRPADVQADTAEYAELLLLGSTHAVIGRIAAGSDGRPRAQAECRPRRAPGLD